MNLFTKILTILSVFVIFAPVNYPQDCKSKLNINTDLETSFIYLNHKLIGKGSATIELGKGTYDITIMKREHEWDGDIINDSVEIAQCGINKKLVYSFKNQVYLDSSPQDAMVYAADSLIGFTPMFVSENYNRLKLIKTDYESREISPADLTQNKPVNLVFNGVETEEHFYNKPIFKYLIGGVVAFGTAAVYFKLKADNAFDDYKTTNDQSFLDKTHKYDTLSGISLGILQVNFGILIYYFLTD